MRRPRGHGPDLAGEMDPLSTVIVGINLSAILPQTPPMPGTHRAGTIVLVLILLTPHPSLCINLCMGFPSTSSYRT
jgi:hypothetical protein